MRREPLSRRRASASASAFTVALASLRLFAIDDALHLPKRVADDALVGRLVLHRDADRALGDVHLGRMDVDVREVDGRGLDVDRGLLKADRNNDVGRFLVVEGGDEPSLLVEYLYHR